MALKNCWECGKKVSTEAASCPSCGAPNPTTTHLTKKENFISKGIEDFKRGFYGEEYTKKKKDIKVDIHEQKKGLGFWKGHEGLAITFWGYFVGGNIVGNVLLLAAQSEKGLVPFVLLVIIGWNVFAVMGVFNSANIYKAEKIKQGQTYGYATAAKIACVVLILSGIGSNLPKWKSF